MQIEGADPFRTKARKESGLFAFSEKHLFCPRRVESAAGRLPEHAALLVLPQASRERRAVGRNGCGKGPPAPKRTCFDPRRVESAGRWGETGAKKDLRPQKELAFAPGAETAQGGGEKQARKRTSGPKKNLL